MPVLLDGGIALPYSLPKVVSDYIGTGKCKCFFIWYFKREKNIKRVLGGENRLPPCPL